MANTLTNTKEKLLDVALDLVQRHGVNGMSFRDLSDQVGIRKASVHHHFANKAEMIKALAQRQLACFNENLQAIAASKTTGKNKLKKYCSLFVNTLESGSQQRGCLFGMLMAEFSSVNECAQEQICGFMQSNIAFLEKVLVEGAEDGSLSKAKNVKATAKLILSTVEGGLFVARCDGGPKQLTETSSQLIQLLST